MKQQITLVMLLLLFVPPAVQTQAFADTSLRAGAASVDISPEGLPAIKNGGFLQASADHVADPLYARAMVLSDGNETIAIVIVDSCMIPTTLCDQIKQMAQRDTGIRADRILISATHTHSAPSVMDMCLGSSADEAYVKSVPARVAAAIAEAHRNLESAKLGWAIVDGSDLTNCRRWITRSDRMETDPFGQKTVRAMMHPGYQNPNYTSPAGPIDPWLSVISVVSAEDEAPLCLLANLSMHYFGGSGGFSADYFGDVARLLEAEMTPTGDQRTPRFVGMMSQGTSGDLHWMDYSQPRRDMDRQGYSQQVADHIWQARKTIEHRSDLSLAMAEKRLKINRRTPSLERREWARAINAKRLNRPPRDRTEVYAQQAEWIHENPNAEVVLQAIRIGELGITAIPNEVYGITGLKLKRQSPLAATLNLELANGATGYIPPPEQHRLGGYTTWPARTAGLDEQAEPLIVEELLELLETVTQRKRRPLVPFETAYSKAVARQAPAAYWRLDDMDTTQAKDSMGNHHANYRGPVALFLPESTKSAAPQGNFGDSSAYGNRCVYLAGGYFEASLAPSENQYSVLIRFCNMLPTDARPTTGVLISNETETLMISGNDAAENAGKLALRCGDEIVLGRTPLDVGHWNHVALTRNHEQIRVYLNGHAIPEIDVAIRALKMPAHWLFGSDGNPSATLDGKVDEVAVYDRALEPKEVADIYGTLSDYVLRPQDVENHLDAVGVQRVAQPAKEQAVSSEKPVPMEVDAALRTIHVPKGFRVELVAAEPMVMDPVAIDWGPDGKLWVVEMADYPLGMDGNGAAGGRVRFLEDTDGDGQYDQSTLFAQGLSFPTGILTWGKGVLVTAAPEILYLEDSTGDGKADVRRVLYSGFLEGNQQLRVNGLRWGLDNWVYCASGSHHGGYGKDSQILSLATGEKHAVGSRDFRIRPETGELDPQSGPSQYGRNRDDWGNWFGVQNSYPLWHYVLDDHNIRRNPHFAPPDPKHQVVTPANPPVYPASQLQKRYHNFSQSGRFTSACSAMIYRDEYLFPPGSEQHAFTCEPFHNLVQHNLISDEGVSFRFRRAPAESSTDFFASEDRWCRPVMVRTGPDGGLWVVDMYRYMIEHPEWLPQNGKDELRPWYRSGDDRGRIYRVVREDLPARKPAKLIGLSAEQLVATLESPNGWQRDMAQRILVRQNRKTAIAPLADLASRSRYPLARLHALWTLDGLGVLSPETLTNALADPHPGIRRNGVRIAADVPVDTNHLLRLVSDPDAKVRLELASTLGEYVDAGASTALAELAISSEGEQYMLAAVMSSLNAHNVADVAGTVLNARRLNDFSIALELVGQAMAMGDQAAISRLLEMIAEGRRPKQQQFALLAQALNQLEARKWPTEELPVRIEELVSKSIQQARSLAADESAEEEVRACSILLLARQPANREKDLRLLEQLLNPQSPAAVQQSIVRRLAQLEQPLVASILLGGWKAYSPTLRLQILDTLSSRTSWMALLLERLEDETIHAGELSITIRQRLLERSKNGPRWEKALSVKTSANRADILQDFQGSLALQGDVEQGGVFFRKLCIHCHRLGDEGFSVGPELASLTDKSKEALLTAIIDPNAAVDAKYLSYNVLTADGRIHSGKLETETGSSITLLAAEGKRTTVLRSEMEQLQASNKSVMPEGIENELSPQDMADLLEFVRQAFR
ncbi:MAG: c-type cytochrome [bacterium]|nr:c-type cytochrome [bacterium]